RRADSSPAAQARTRPEHAARHPDRARCRICVRRSGRAGLNVHQVAPRQPILLATRCRRGALAWAGVSELLSTPLVSDRAGYGVGALPGPRRLKRDCLNRSGAPTAAHSLPLKGEELGWVLTSDRLDPAHFTREPLRSLNGQIGYIRLRLER